MPQRPVRQTIQGLLRFLSEAGFIPTGPVWAAPVRTLSRRVEGRPEIVVCHGVMVSWIRTWRFRTRMTGKSAAIRRNGNGARKRKNS